MFNKHDISRNAMMLTGSFGSEGYDWWWHSFTAINQSTGEEKAFFIEYFLCNPALGEKRPVFGQLPENKRIGVRPSYLMVKAGCWGEDHCQLHRFFGIKNIRLHPAAPYCVMAEDCFASDICLKGSVSLTPSQAKAHPEYMSDAGEMSWDLRLDKKTAFNVGYGASSPLRAIKAFEMYWHAEGMKTLYSGTVIFNGEKYIVTPQTSYGYADKNWGRNFTSPWIWLSSCCLTSRITGKQLKNSVFDIGGGRPKIYCLPLENKLLGALYLEGEEFEYNFSKPWTLPHTKFRAEETDDEIKWHIRQENYKSIMMTDVSCKKKDMLLVNYESPDGMKRHDRLWNGGNGIGRIRVYRKHTDGLTLAADLDATHIGCEYGVYAGERDRKK